MDVADEAASATGDKPNLDFALAALARVLHLPSGSPLTLFAIGRTFGWIGHAIEQYATGQLIRPRAKYVGILPRPSLMNGMSQGQIIRHDAGASQRRERGTPRESQRCSGGTQAASVTANAPMTKK